MNLIVNNGNLVNEDGLDTKLDFDPTETMQINFTTNISYKQIFLEVTRFTNINNNNNNYNVSNNNKTHGRHLEYPKFYFDSKKPKCEDTTRCKRCHGNSNNGENSGFNSLFNLCLTKRREMANKLLDRGQEQECMTDSLSTTARQLYTGDKLLKKDSMTYKTTSNWFINLYSYLQWQREVAHVLLQNLVQLKKKAMDTKDTGTGDSMVHHEEKKIDPETTTESGVRIDVSRNNIEDWVFFWWLYLDQLIECLVLYYTCFDTQSWICVFHPLIESAIGTYYCKRLFAEKSSYSKNVPPICGESLQLDWNKQNSIIRNRCRDEMKALSLFKRLLYDTYQNDGYDNEEQDNNNDNNAFDLSYKIYIKLQETINNIKSQMVIHEMTGKNVYEKTHDDTNKGEPVKEEMKDDWDVGQENNRDENQMKIDAPSFIRLFVIRRVVENYIRNCNTKQKTIKIRKLASVFAKKSKTESIVVDIVTRLIDGGIKQYMNLWYHWYNDKTQINIIEMIFKDIISTQFQKESYKLVTYVGNELERNMVLLFNSRDLMSNIFQYLEYGSEFDGDMVSCSLVNSQWLYHVWNLNSIYFVDLTNLVGFSLALGCDYPINIRVVSRMLQRFIHAKHILIKNKITNPAALESKRVSNVLMMFGRLKKVHFISMQGTQDVELLKALMWKSSHKIEWCNIKFFGTFLENQVSSLKLINARHIEIGDLYFYRLWTDKCESLVLSMNDISQAWYQYVVKHCNSSNIKYLDLDLCIYADDEKKDDMEMVLTQFATKFTSLCKLKIIFRTNFDRNMLVLWQLMKPMLDQNSGCVEVVLDKRFSQSKLSHDDAKFLNNTIKNQHLHIDSLVTLYPNGKLSHQIIYNWNIGCLIGSGRFGDVYQATHVEHKTKAAVKFISQTDVTDKRYLRRKAMIRNEIAGLSKTKHNNVIKLLGHNVNVEKHAMLIFEYMKNGNLQQYLEYNDTFELEICKRLFDQIVDGLNYLHNGLYIAHRDIKPSSILLDDQFSVKIADFGLCKQLCDTSKNSDNKNQVLKHSMHGVGEGYIAPEMIFQSNSSEYNLISNDEISSCDIFSLGIILWKMLMGNDSHPFEKFKLDSQQSIVDCPIFRLICDTKYDVWWKLFENGNEYFYNSDLKHLFTRMFDPFPQSRITINDIKNEKWYKKIVMNKTQNQEYFSAQMHTLCVKKEIG